jgi:phage shock protein C
VDVTLIRLLTLVAAIFTGIGFIAYVIAWIVIPEEPILVPQTQVVHSQSGPPMT